MKRLWISQNTRSLSLRGERPTVFAYLGTFSCAWRVGGIFTSGCDHFTGLGMTRMITQWLLQQTHWPCETKTTKGTKSSCIPGPSLRAGCPLEVWHAFFPHHSPPSQIILSTSKTRYITKARMTLLKCLQQWTTWENKTVRDHHRGTEDKLSSP